jgi:hypothetical protein
MWTSGAAHAGILLQQDFESGVLDPRMSVQTVGAFYDQPGIVALTNFGSSQAFAFGRSVCGANCFDDYVTHLKITFPTPMLVTRITFKDIELYSNWGSGGWVSLDGVREPALDFCRLPWNDWVPDTDYRVHDEVINKVAREIELSVVDITSASEVFIDDLVIYGSPAADIRMFAGVILNGTVGDQYRIDYSTMLPATNWTTLTNITLSSPSYIYIDYDSPNSSRRFYRTQLISP